HTAVSRLVEWIDGEEPKGGCERRLPRTRRRLLVDERTKRSQSGGPDLLALARQPLLEAGGLEAKAFEELAAIEISRLSEDGLGPLGHAWMEGDNVHVEERGVQGDLVAIHLQSRHAGASQSLSQDGERHAKVVAGVLLLELVPQEGDQVVAQELAAGMNCQ